MTSSRIASARSLLFVPGHRADRFDKAIASGADAIVIDLEDSVPPANKPAARTAIEAEWSRLQQCAMPVLVRINAHGTEAGRQDLLWLERLPTPAGIMLPKAECSKHVAWVHETLSGVPVLPIIESAAGYAAVSSVAAAAGVVRLAIGHLDFLADTGMQCDDDQTELVPLRFAVAMATRLSGLAPAVDGVTDDIGAEQRLRTDVHRAVRFGFGGKLCIHPAQVGIVHDAFMPSGHELEWAHKVIAADAAANGAAAQLDGRMVDLPVVLRARRLLGRQ